jgi:hypothetical protein
VAVAASANSITRRSSGLNTSLVRHVGTAAS